MFVAHNGAYNKGERCSLSDTVFKIIGTMKVGQKVLIEEKDAEEKKDDGHEGVRI